MVTTLNEPLFSAVELEKIAAEVAEDQREFDAWVAQLQTPAAKTEAAALAKEAAATWESFARSCAAGQYDLTPTELAQLQRDGILVKCHTIKS